MNLNPYLQSHEMDGNLGVDDGLFGHGKCAGAQSDQMRDGKVGVSIYYLDTLLNIGSNKLRVMVDDVTMDVTIAVNPSTFASGIDSLDEKLSEGTSNDIVFRGRLGMDKLWVKGKPIQHFDIPGTLMMNGEAKEIRMNGSIRDYREGGVEMLLYMHYDITLSDFNLDEQLPGFAKTGCIEMLQGLMVPTSKD